MSHIEPSAPAPVRAWRGTPAAWTVLGGLATAAASVLRNLGQRAARVRRRRPGIAPPRAAEPWREPAARLLPADGAEAGRDGLTGLPDRRLFRRRLAGALDQAHRRAGRVAVHWLDVDMFKDINEALGHAAGDALLCLAAERLRACLGEADTLARLDGNGFGVVQAEAADPPAAAALAGRLVAALRRPFMVHGHELLIGVCLGRALSPGDGRDADELLRNAETALHAAKAEGPNRSRPFAADMRQRAGASRALERDLRRALHDGALTLHYQPKFALPDCRLVGMEALLRWSHPERGPVPPAEFIPAAERSGLIAPLGAWALAAACRRNRAWQRAGLLPRLRVAVNLSAAQFDEPDGLVAAVAGALEGSGLAPDDLELEITESVLLCDTREVLATLTRLRGMGVHLALDDFGMGYSALGYLQRFAFDVLKIDRSFVAGLDAAGGAVPIVRAVVDLAHDLDMTVVAEGVETAAQLRRLQLMACDAVQGFLLARPECEAAFAARLGAPAAGGSA